MLGMKITVTFDTYILTPVAVVTKEPKTSLLLWSPAAKFMNELKKKVMNPNLLDLLDSKEKEAWIVDSAVIKVLAVQNRDL